MLQKTSRLIRNLWIDLKIQRRFIGGQIKSRYLDKGFKDITNTDYSTVHQFFFDFETIKPDDVIVDVGCGRGRVITYLLHKGIKSKIIGVEYDPITAKETANALKKYKNVEIREGDVLDNFPFEGTLFYMFNPFTEKVAVPFSENLLKVERPNQMRLLYYFPSCAAVFENNEKFDCAPLSTKGNHKRDALHIKING